jgi:hypothetical protein
MNAEELKQLISLHGAYQKHVPVVSNSVWGVFSSGRTVCKTCLMPLRLSADNATPLNTGELTPGDITLNICGLMYQAPAIFNMFKRQAYDMGMAQAYSDLVLTGATNVGSMSSLWQTIRQLGLPTEAVLSASLDGNPAMALEAARYIPELQPRAYSAIIASENITVMHRYCQGVISHTDKRMLAAAQKIAGQHECANVAAEMEQFLEWHKRKLAWEK